MARILRSEQLHHDRRGGAHIFHRVVAIGLLQPRLRPGVDRQRRRTRGIERRRLEMAREHQPLVDGKIAIVFVVVAFKAVLHVHSLLGADEAELQVLQRDAVVGMPAAQHRARDLHRNAADRRALPDPARRRIADPRLAVALVHVFDDARRRSSSRGSGTARRRPRAAACSGRACRGLRETAPPAGGGRRERRTLLPQQRPRRVTTVRISPVKKA